MNSETTPAGRVQGRTRTHDLPVRARPLDGEWRRHLTPDRRAVLVHLSALWTIRATERRHAPDETGGLLLGRFFRDAAGEYVLVTSAETPRDGEVIGTRSTVRITAAGAEAMAARAQLREPAADVVGWFHTHPDYAAYFSRVDRDEQAGRPFALAVGLVISGQSPAGANDEYAVFVGPDSALAEFVGWGLSDAASAEHVAHAPTAPAPPVAPSAAAAEHLLGGSNGRVTAIRPAQARVDGHVGRAGAVAESTVRPPSARRRRWLALTCLLVASALLAATLVRACASSPAGSGRTHRALSTRRASVTPARRHVVSVTPARSGPVAVRALAAPDLVEATRVRDAQAQSTRPGGVQ